MTISRPSSDEPSLSLRIASTIATNIARIGWRPRAKLTYHTFVPASEFRPPVISIKVRSIRRAALRLQSVSFVWLLPGKNITLPINARAKPLSKGDVYTQLCHPEQLFREGQSWQDLAYVSARDQYGTQHRLYIASMRQIGRQKLINAGTSVLRRLRWTREARNTYRP
jgi:hypothetical protein